MPTTPPSIRSLARELGLSGATVSLALRESPRVVPETRRRVQEAAERAGYRPNALVSSVLTGVRRSSHNGFQGALMAINYSTAKEPALPPYHREILDGAQSRAAALGYTLTHCWTGPHALSLNRLNTILAARGVRGVMVMPFPEAQDFSSLDWNGLAGVVMDHCLSAPSVTTILPDHHLALFNALKRLWAQGYRRPGLVLDRPRDERLHFRWSAAYGSFSRTVGRDELVPVLMAAPLRADSFQAWFAEHQPDVIIGHIQTETARWLSERGLHIPEHVGFLHLNWTERSGSCAALDLQPAVLGGAAVEAVVAQLQRNERGLPENPKTILMPARWVDGPTLRASAPTPNSVGVNASGPVLVS